MEIFYIIIILMFLLGYLLKYFNNQKYSEDIQQIDYSNYEPKKHLMTNTELKFYNLLEIITEKLELKVCPQVNLEQIILVKNKNNAYRNRIKSRSIDYTIIQKKDSKIVCCIELDDYTHNTEDRIKRDIFVNELFQNTKIHLLRIKVADYYDINEIEEKIKECINTL